MGEDKVHHPLLNQVKELETSISIPNSHLCLNFLSLREVEARVDLKQLREYGS